MISKNDDVENPIGPESPSFEFSWSLGQVFLGLFVIAVGLTAWKQYEARFVAPKTPVSWQVFQTEHLQQARLQNRSVLIAVVPVAQEQAARQIVVLASPKFQRAVFLARPLAIRIESIEHLDADDLKWFGEHLPSVNPGDLVWFDSGNEKRIRSLPFEQLTPERAAALVDDPWDQP